MIYDSLEKLGSYMGLHENLDKAIQSYFQTDFSHKEKGKYEVDGNKVFYMIQENKLNTVASDELEFHKKYLDLHFLLEGHERIGAGRDLAEIRKVYNDADDIGMVSCQKLYPLEINEDTFALFFPDEPHQPNQFAGKEHVVRKCVYKVLID